MIPLLLLACAVDCERADPTSGDTECRVPGWSGRDYLLHLPDGWDGARALDVVLALHGGGGRKEGMPTATCADGEETDDACLDVVADEEGFAVAYPDGTAAFLGAVRTWNAGGGEDGWRCVSGDACRDGVDDLAYFDALLANLRDVVPVARVFATGISNGAAMSHRLACARDDVAAIAPVAGTNQVAAVQGCEPAAAVPVLQIHGTDDPCWGYDGGTGACLQDDGDAYVSVADSMAGWAERNGCDGATATASLDDVADDGMTSTRTTWEGCDAPVELIAVDGGGHTWPGGQQYADAEKVGAVTADFSASRVMWAFFASVGG